MTTLLQCPFSRRKIIPRKVRRILRRADPCQDLLHNHHQYHGHLFPPPPASSLNTNNNRHAIKACLQLHPVLLPLHAPLLTPNRPLTLPSTPSQPLPKPPSPRVQACRQIHGPVHNAHCTTRSTTSLAKLAAWNNRHSPYLRTGVSLPRTWVDRCLVCPSRHHSLV